MRKRLGLAGTRPRNDQQGPAARAVLRGAGLIRVEVCKTVRWRHGSELRSIPKIKMITICAKLLPFLPHAPPKPDITENFMICPPHPFARFIQILGRGKTLSRSLTIEEAQEAMAMILAGDVMPEQLVLSSCCFG